MIAHAAVAPVSAAFPHHSINAMDIDQYVDLAENCSTMKELDLGNVTLRIVLHPVHGQIVLANTTGEKHAAIRL